MADVFISYSRTDIAFARRLHAGLIENGLDTWIDWQDIPPSTDWLAEVYTAIEQADAFIFIISKDSVTSEVCSSEITHASQNNKRLIPIVVDDIEPQKVTPTLAALNWIFFREIDDFDESIRTLIQAVQTDQAWVKAHTHYQNRALEWERKDQTPDFLLRGNELEEAEAWFSQASEKDPQPTALQAQFLLACRQDATRRQRFALGAAVLGLVLTVALGLTAWNQRNQAIAAGNIRATAEVEAIFESNTRATAEADAIAVGYQRATAQVDAEDKRQEASAQRELAISRQLSAQSTVHLEPDQLDLSLLFAVQAARIEDTFEARSSLLNGLRYRPHLQRILYGDASGSLGFGNGLAFSADGEMIASGNDNGTITLWEVSTGRQVGDPLVGHENWVSSLAFSPDGSLLASGSHDETVILWDVATRQPLDQPLTGLPRLVFDLAFSANGDLLAVSCGQDIFLLEVASRDLVYGFHMLGGTTRSVAFSPDGKILAATDYKSLTAGGSVVLWNLETGEKLAEVNKAHISGGFAVAFHPNGNSLATGGDGRHIFDYGEVRFWDSLTLQPLDNKLVKLPGHVRDIAFLPGGEQLVFNLEDKIWLWELDADLPVVQSFPAYVKDMVLSPAGDLLATIGPNATVYVWDLVDRQSNIQHPIEASEQVASVAYHPEGIILASGGCGQRAEEGGPCTRGRIRFWDTQTEAPANQPFEGHAGEVTSLAFHPDGASFASGGEDGTIILWAELTGEWVSQLIRGHEGEITQVAFSPDGGILASSSSDGVVALWDAATGEPFGEPLIRHSDPITSLVFSPEGGILASGSEAGTILFWDIANGDQILKLMNGEPVSSLAFSPDGARLASGGESGAISVWDTAKGTLVDQPLSVHKEAVIGIVFRPGMDMLASASADGEVIFWDAASRHVIGGPLVGDSRALRTLAISPNGNRLASGGEDGITLWDISLEAWQEHACQIANRNLTSEEWEATLGELPYQKTCPNLP